MEVHNVGRSRCRYPSDRGYRVAAALCLAPLPLPTSHVEGRQNVCRKRVSAVYLYSLYVLGGLHGPFTPAIVITRTCGFNTFLWCNSYIKKRRKSCSEENHAMYRDVISVTDAQC